MSSGQSLREFISKRLTAAAAEIFSEFEGTIVRYEEEIARQRRLLELCWNPQINLHRIELPLHYVLKDEEVLTEQQLCNQERSSSLDQEQPEPLQEGPEPPQTKVEQDEPEPLHVLEEEELCISQDEEQFVQKQEMVTSLVTPDEEGDHDEPEPVSDQLLFSVFPEAEIGATDPPGSTAIPELPQHHVWKIKEVMADQQHSNEEMTSSLDQKEPEPPLIKEEQQKLSIHLHEGPFIVKQENLTFRVASPSEETDMNQPLCQSSAEAENRDQDGCRNENSESNSNEALTQNKHRDGEKLKGHRDERRFSCNICGRFFTRNCHLAIHLRAHRSEKLYSCQICSKCFFWSDSLIKHMRTHTSEKQYPCEFCGKCFSSNGNWTAHMRTHTGEKPYPCDICGKCFSRNYTLMKHTRTHTGVKPYPCDICGKCFSRNYNLMKHTRTHTGEKPYPCKTCGKCFSTSDSLFKHVRIHTGEKPYSCKICGKCFSQHAHLARHKKTHHV